MQRLFSKNATGIAPDGRWYAGDVNAMQDASAGQSDFTQFIDLGGIRIGESVLQLLRYGPSEARLSGALRLDGILRSLGGIYAGAFTTTQRDAIPTGFRPYGLVILNSTTNRLEINLGSDPTPNWKPLGVDPTTSADFFPQTTNNYFISSRRATDNNPRFRIREDGREEWGDGTNVTDTFLERTAAGVLSRNGVPVVTSDDPGLANNVKIVARPDPLDIFTTTVETDILNYTAPANMMTSKGELKYDCIGQWGHPTLHGGLEATIRLYLGGTLIGSMVMSGSGSNQTLATGSFTIYIRNAGATNAQRIFMSNGTPGWGGNGGSDAIFKTTIDTTQPLPVRVSVQFVGTTGYSLEIYTHYMEFRK